MFVSGQTPNFQNSLSPLSSGNWGLPIHAQVGAKNLILNCSTPNRITPCCLTLSVGEIAISLFKMLICGMKRKFGYKRGRKSWTLLACSQTS
jgi:hypothetical protein